jgi:hypothetical protein
MFILLLNFGSMSLWAVLLMFWRYMLGEGEGGAVIVYIGFGPTDSGQQLHDYQSHESLGTWNLE